MRAAAVRETAPRPVRPRAMVRGREGLVSSAQGGVVSAGSMRVVVVGPGAAPGFVAGALAGASPDFDRSLVSSLRAAAGRALAGPGAAPGFAAGALAGAASDFAGSLVSAWGAAGRAGAGSAPGFAGAVAGSVAAGSASGGPVLGSAGLVVSADGWGEVRARGGFRLPVGRVAAGSCGKSGEPGVLPVGGSERGGIGSDASKPGRCGRSPRAASRRVGGLSGSCRGPGLGSCACSSGRGWPPRLGRRPRSTRERGGSRTNPAVERRIQTRVGERCTCVDKRSALLAAAPPPTEPQLRRQGSARRARASKRRKHPLANPYSGPSSPTADL